MSITYPVILEEAIPYSDRGVLPKGDDLGSIERPKTTRVGNQLDNRVLLVVGLPVLLTYPWRLCGVIDIHHPSAESSPEIFSSASQSRDLVNTDIYDAQACVVLPRVYANLAIGVAKVNLVRLGADRRA